MVIKYMMYTRYCHQRTQPHHHHHQDLNEETPERQFDRHLDLSEIANIMYNITRNMTSIK